MKEMGGYFGLDEFVNNAYYKNSINLNNGRNALLYLLKAKKIETIFLPYYLCNSVADLCNKNNVRVEYYNINADFMPLFSEKVTAKSYVYIVNYFGQLSEQQVYTLQSKFENMILDNTQAFYQKPILKMDTIYSCRKFFGVSDGAYLSTTSYLNDELIVDKSKDRMVHILGRYEGSATEYYSYFQSNDATFKMEPLKKMSKLTQNILGAIDYENVRITRNNNYLLLENRLKSLNKLNLIIPDGPFAYPFYVDNGIEIRKKLSENKIFIPILWPNVIKNNANTSLEYQYAANILPLPCDQRYTCEDMEYMISILKLYVII